MSMTKGMLVLGLVALGAIGIMGSHSDVVQAETNSAHPVRCPIQVERRSSGIELKGMVFASSAVAGSYQMLVSSSGGGGSSNINQAGEFEAQPGTPAMLGMVTLGHDGGTYVAKLRVVWNGNSIECTERVRGSL